MGAPLRIEPVGGLGQMGHHHMVVDNGPDSFLVDCGILFPPPSDPGIDRILPSFEPALQRAKEGRLRGLLLTHGHLDHLGAVPDLLAALPGLPVYATPWTMTLLRRRFDRDAPKGSAPLERRLVHPGETITVGETELTWLRVTHSLPEACSLAMRGPGGTVVHSGDFRMQVDPLLGPPTDAAGLKAIGDGGVDLALVDSTSGAKPGRTLPERDVVARLTEVAEKATGAVIVTTFSSHVERMLGCLQVARATGRRFAIYGRSAEETARAAIEAGLLPVRSGELLSIDAIEETPKSKLLVLVTGSQGEWRAPLARIARGEDSRLTLGKGDMVIWSARVIPGGERTVGGLVNRFAEAGVTVVPPWGEGSHGLHTSGHGHSDEVGEWLDLVQPRFVLPIHGEPWHLIQHQSALARRVGPERLLSLRTGQTLELDVSTDVVTHGEAKTTQQWVAYGGAVFPARDPALSTRRKAGQSGAATVVVPWRDGRVAGTPVVHALGLVAVVETSSLERRLGLTMHRKLSLWDPIDDEGEASEKARLTLRSIVRREVGSKPPCLARLLHLDGMVSYAELDAHQPDGTRDGANGNPTSEGQDPPE